MPALYELKGRDYWRLSRPYSAIMAVGLAIFLYPVSWPLATAAQAVAGTVFGVGLIGLVIQLSSLKQIVEHVGKDMASRVTALHLPAELRTLVRGLVETTLVRTGSTKTYRLHRQDGKMEVVVEWCYEVRNHGSQVVDYAPSIGGEAFYSPRFTYLEYRLPDETGHSFTEGELAQKARDLSDTHVRNIDEGLASIKLRPFATDPQAACKVTWRYTVIMPEEYSDVTAFGGAFMGHTVKLDEVPDDIDFVCVGPNVQHLPGSRTWEFPNPYIDRQHVRVWWFKKDASGDGDG